MATRLGSHAVKNDTAEVLGGSVSQAPHDAQVTFSLSSTYAPFAVKAKLGGKIYKKSNGR
jgi:hypothetical protein